MFDTQVEMWCYEEEVSRILLYVTQLQALC